MNAAQAILERLGRTVVLLALVAVGTIALMRLAPGYFSDAREMDARYAQSARSELSAERSAQASVWSTGTHALGGWLHGDMGQSRQYEMPVSQLLGPRLRVTASLLAHGIVYGWLLAFCTALPVSTMRRGGAMFGMPFTLLLAIPTGAMATVCLLTNLGGPVLVLTLLLAARDFKFLERVLHGAWTSPHVLQARAQGLRMDQMLRGHVLPNVLPNLLALATLSLITALSAIVPVEVIFDVPGVGQLAWSAAMNRDLPVLLAVTLMMATAVAFAGLVSHPARTLETA